MAYSVQPENSEKKLKYFLRIMSYKKSWDIILI